MDDPILDRFKARDSQERAAQKADIDRRRERASRERQQTLDLLPETLDRLFGRLEAIDYRGGAVEGVVRSIKLESGEMTEAVVWCVSQSEPRRWTREDWASDTYFVTSGRFFAKTEGAFPSGSDTLVQVNLENISIVELRRVMEGLERVGSLRSA